MNGWMDGWMDYLFEGTITQRSHLEREREKERETGGGIYFQRE
jgi:hypothetical protein